ncbi:MAG: putative capsid protein [Circoviridae sp.]|nr:MAG: putative capsid protein [Circoviridae sp.]
MPRVTFGRLSKRKSTIKRKRPGTLSRAKYAPKTTRMNRSLITQNAYAIKAIRKLQPDPVFCDWQYTGVESPFTPLQTYNTLQTIDLMNPTIWGAVLRQDPNVLSSSSTCVKRMSINLRSSLGEANWCQTSIFIVSIRKDAADREIRNSGLTEGEDYVFNSQGFNPTLNSRVFKVHYVRHMSLMTSAWQLEKAVAGNAEFIGNPQTTLKKGTVNMKLDFKLRQPNGTTWKNMEIDQLPPYQRLHMLMFFKGNSNDVDLLPPRVDWDAHFVTYNAS